MPERSEPISRRASHRRVGQVHRQAAASLLVSLQRAFRCSQAASARARARAGLLVHRSVGPCPPARSGARSASTSPWRRTPAPAEPGPRSCARRICSAATAAGSRHCARGFRSGCTIGWRSGGRGRVVRHLRSPGGVGRRGAARAAARPVHPAHAGRGRRQERRYATLDALGAALAFAYQVNVRPDEPGGYYYAASLQVSTLSDSDLDELERFLAGDLDGGGQGGKGIGERWAGERPGFCYGWQDCQVSDWRREAIALR